MPNEFLRPRGDKSAIQFILHITAPFLKWKFAAGINNNECNYHKITTLTVVGYLKS